MDKLEPLKALTPEQQEEFENRREKLTVAKHWHHFHVRKPQTL